jgi:hypothetical protein
VSANGEFSAIVVVLCVRGASACARSQPCCEPACRSGCAHDAAKWPRQCSRASAAPGCICLQRGQRVGILGRPPSWPFSRAAAAFVLDLREPPRRPSIAAADSIAFIGLASPTHARAPVAPR